MGIREKLKVTECCLNIVSSLNARFPATVLSVFPILLSFPWHGTAIKVQRPGCLGFLAWQRHSILASAEKEICCVQCMVLPLWSEFHLRNSLLSRVTGSVSSSPPVKRRSSLKKTEDPVLSVRLVFHGHVVASVTPPPTPKLLLTRLENTRHIVQIL